MIQQWDSFFRYFFSFIPVNYDNLEKFLSGINNVKNTKRQNCLQLKSSVHFLLIAERKIHKGKILHYHYNSVGHNNYNRSFWII